jgi:hypothetical protein
MGGFACFRRIEAAKRAGFFFKGWISIFRKVFCVWGVLKHQYQEIVLNSRRINSFRAENLCFYCREIEHLKHNSIIVHRFMKPLLPRFAVELQLH